MKRNAPSEAKESADHGVQIGADRDAILADFARWLDLNPDPWRRAVEGLRMFVPDNGRGYWP